MSEIKQKIINLQKYLDSRIIGQRNLIKKLLTGMLAGGHILVEGAPGLAKTKAIKTLSECINANYTRIQFTPDLLPSDITGSDVYIASNSSFEFHKGPIFTNLLLADEINRAPAKVQSALLEAMAENQVSVGGRQYPLPELFMVMATQNPIEQEGTYNLPEAQLDRFLMYVKIDQPDIFSEQKILKLVREEEKHALAAESLQPNRPRLEISDILSARKEVLDMYMSEQVEKYLIEFIMATRNAEKYNSKLKNMIAYGASPRATIALDKCAKINAWLENRDYVTPEDIYTVIYDVLRHRIILSFEAQAEGYTSDDIITSLIKQVPLP